MYSASVVLKAIRDCIKDFNKMGHPAYITTKPVCQCADIESWDDLFCHDPAQSASTKHSSPQRLLGTKHIPLSLVARIYQPICLTASLCLRFGLLQKQAHC